MRDDQVRDDQVRDNQDRARLAMGTVVARSAATMSATVRFDQHGITSRSLRVLTALAFGARVYNLPRIGDFVACLMDDQLNAGVVLGCAYTAVSLPPADPASPNVLNVTADDGAVIQYDPDTSAYLVDVPAGGSITHRIGRSALTLTDDGVTITAPLIDMVKA